MNKLIKRKGVELTFRKNSVDGHPKTKHVENLGEVGMAVDLICQETGLSRGQVLYRLQKKGIKLSDYRYAKNAIGKYVKRRVYDMTRREIQEMIKTRLLLKA